jgi:hypothetical protein
VGDREPGDQRNGAGRDAAERLAIAALSFLASEPEHLGAFLASTGIGPGDIRGAARDPHFLAGVLDYLSGEESVLIAFAQHAGVDPSEITRARAALGGVWEQDLP